MKITMVKDVVRDDNGDPGLSWSLSYQSELDGDTDLGSKTLVKNSKFKA